jgi:hypothetical protein
MAHKGLKSLVVKITDHFPCPFYTFNPKLCCKGLMPDFRKQCGLLQEQNFFYCKWIVENSQAACVKK